MGVAFVFVLVLLGPSRPILLGLPGAGAKESEKDERRREASPPEPSQLTMRRGFMPEQPSCLAAVEQRPV